MDNIEFLRDLKFGVGDGILNYYMYNYHIMSDNKGFPVSTIYKLEYLITNYLLRQHNLELFSCDHNSNSPNFSYSISNLPSFIRI